MRIGSEINFFLREPTGDKPKTFGRQMEGFGRQKQVLLFFFFWFLACHATIVASPLNLTQTKENNLSGQGIIYLNL